MTSRSGALSPTGGEPIELTHVTSAAWHNPGLTVTVQASMSLECFAAGDVGGLKIEALSAGPVGVDSLTIPTVMVNYVRCPSREFSPGEIEFQVLPLEEGIPA